MPETRLYIDLPDSLRDLIERSGLSLTDLLQAEGAPPGLIVRPAALPAVDNREGSRTRDVGFVIEITPELLLSAAAAGSMLMLAVSKFLRDRARDPKPVEIWQTKTITDADGRERQVLVPETILLEPSAGAGADFEARLDWNQGALLRFRTVEQEPDALPNELPITTPATDSDDR
jgi:hypothetical protein